MRIITRALFVTAAVAFLLGASSCSRPTASSRDDPGGRHYEQRAYEAAKLDYQRVLQSDPAHVLATARLGLIWFEQGAPVQALPFLIRAAEQQPENLEVKRALALALLSVGRVAEARVEARALLTLPGGRDEAIGLLAQTVRSHAELKETIDEIRRPARPTAATELASATLALARGDLVAAKAALERSLRLDAKSAAAHGSLASLHLAQGQFVEAGAAYKRAAELAPPYALAHIKYAEFLARRGSADDARSYLERHRSNAPEYIPLPTALAQISLFEKKTEQARQEAGAVLERWPDNYEALLLRAQCHLHAGRVAVAISDLEELGRRHPTTTAHQVLLARAYLNIQDTARAVPLLERSYRSNPDHIDAALILAQLHLQQRQPDRAVTVLLDVLARRPTLAPAQLLLATAFQQQGRVEPAMALVQGRLRESPSAPELHFVEGLLHLQQKRPGDARRSFESAAGLARDEPAYAAQLVELDLRERDVPAALRRVTEFLQRMPDSADLHFMRARVLLVQNRWSETEAALSRTLELNPNFSSAYELLVYVYVRSQQLPRALQQLDNILARQPANPRALLLSGMLYGEARDFVRARDRYEQLLKLQPNAVIALNNLATLYADHFEDLDRAVDLARQARQLDPNSPAVADTLGWILVKRQDVREGLELISECALRMPDNGEVNYHLAVAHQLLGNKDDARAAFERARNAQGDFPGKSEISKRIGQLDRD